MPSDTATKLCLDLVFQVVMAFFRTLERPHRVFVLVPDVCEGSGAGHGVHRCVKPNTPWYLSG